MASSDQRLLDWLIARTKKSRGMPFGKIPAAEVDSLNSLIDSGSVYSTDNPPMVWVNPTAIKRKKIQRPANTVVVSETDLPDEEARLDEMPGSDLDPLTILVTDEEDRGISRRDDGILSRRPEYRPMVTLVGCCAWPPPGTLIMVIRGVPTMVLDGPHCPVCKARAGDPDIKCLVCDHKRLRAITKPADEPAQEPAKKKRTAKFRPKGAPAA